MSTTGANNPIIIVDDDEDDLDLIKEAIKHLKLTRPIDYFKNGDELIGHLRQNNQPPFLIICDVNLPRKDGFEVRKQIAQDKELRYKSVPFLFWSTGASEKQIQYAYDLPAQGFFFKPSSFTEICQTLRTLLDYWNLSQHPKTLK